jgi:N-acyl-L-homoserine lactone synthetase
MTNAEYVLKRFEENEDYKYWNVKSAGGKTVESFDRDDLSHAEATQRLSELFSNLEGTYIVSLTSNTEIVGTNRLVVIK